MKWKKLSKNYFVFMEKKTKNKRENNRVMRMSFVLFFFLLRKSSSDDIRWIEKYKNKIIRNKTGY